MAISAWSVNHIFLDALVELLSMGASRVREFGTDYLVDVLPLMLFSIKDEEEMTMEKTSSGTR